MKRIIEERQDVNVKKIDIKKYVYPLTVFISVILILFDYFTFTNVFNFSQASFLDIYLYNLNLLNGQFFIIVALVPLAMVIFTLSFSFISIYFPIQWSDSIKSYYDYHSTEVNLKQIVMFSLIYSVILFILNNLAYFILNNIDIHINSFALFISISLFMIVAIILTYIISYFILNDIYKNYKISSVDIMGVFISFMFMYLFIMNICTPLKDDSGQGVYILLNIYTYFIAGASFLMIEALIIKKFKIRISLNKSSKNKSIVEFFIFLFFIFFILFMIGIHNSNKELWKDQEKITFSVNLLLNNFLLSASHKEINLDIGGHIDVKGCLEKNKKTLDINSTKVLPISKSMSLYFKEVNDKNISSCVYAVEKNYFRGKYIYNLIDTGYINKE